jgi:hypothetical protein
MIKNRLDPKWIAASHSRGGLEQLEKVLIKERRLSKISAREKCLKLSRDLDDFLKSDATTGRLLDKDFLAFMLAKCAEFRTPLRNNEKQKKQRKKRNKAHGLRSLSHRTCYQMEIVDYLMHCTSGSAVGPCNMIRLMSWDEAKWQLIHWLVMLGLYRDTQSLYQTLTKPFGKGWNRLSHPGSAQKYRTAIPIIKKSETGESRITFKATTVKDWDTIMNAEIFRIPLPTTTLTGTMLTTYLPALTGISRIL